MASFYARKVSSEERYQLYICIIVMFVSCEVISSQSRAWPGLAGPQHEINKSNQKSGEGENIETDRAGLGRDSE